MELSPTSGRRTILRAGLAGGALIAGSGWRPARSQAPTTLTLAVWGAQAEQDAFNAVIQRFMARNPGVSIRLDVSGSGGQHYQQVDAKLAGRQGPDLFRVQYQQLGRYATARAIIDIGKYLDAGDAQAFEPAFWQAVTYKGRVVALPHHTDTFALYVNEAMAQKAGLTLPGRLEDSWSWDEFIRAARALKTAGAAYGFAMHWQNVAYRWLPFLHQHGGQMLSDDLSRSILADPKGVEAIAWCQSWFKEGLVPPSTSIKSGEQPQNLFANGTIGMFMGGDWQIPFLSKSMTDPWKVTYMPRDVAMASDLGGNAIAISRDCKAPEIAAAFLKFMVDPVNMEEFIVGAQFLPVRRDLAAKPIPYRLRRDAMEVFVKQASTIPPQMVATETLPSFSKINVKLADELDLAFTSGQDAATTARNIDAAVQPILEA